MTIVRPDEKENNPVEHPNHYTTGKIEVVDFILDQKLNYCLGNAIKYICRCGKKKSKDMSIEEKAIQDLRKAIQYIEFEIEHIEGKR